MNVQEVQGNWRKGWTLDIHTTSSVLIGFDDNGHEKFETTRSELGQLLYELKYRGQRDSAMKIDECMSMFLAQYPLIKGSIDVIVPVPPSEPRSFQPVEEVALALGRMINKPVVSAMVKKVRSTPGIKDENDPAKRSELLAGVFQADASQAAGKCALLIDDLFRSGATQTRSRSR